MPKRNPEQRTRTYYIPKDMIEEILKEARRQERTPSWLLQHAWKKAKHKIQTMRLSDDPDTGTDTE